MTRPATSALITFLETTWDPSTPAQAADLYTFTLITGEVFRYSGFQTPLVAPAPNTNSPLFGYSLGPRFNRTKVKTQVGPQIDELEVDMFVGLNDMLGFASGGRLTWQKAFHEGLFDGAICELDRAFITFPADRSTPPAVVGTLTWFYGRVADIVIGRTKCSIKVKSLLDVLTIQMPRRLFQSSCGWLFGKPGCDFDRTTGVSALGNSTVFGAQTITAGVGSNSTVVYTAFVPSVVTAYDNGSIIGLTGFNAGFTRTIGRLDSSVSPSIINFLKPFAFPVVAGTDTFTLLPGCDHTLKTCVNTFQNQAADGLTGRYGGFPYIPPPETAI